jgi:hypothetical protein
MGTDIVHYIMVGIKLSDSEYQKFEEKINEETIREWDAGVEDFTFIGDGMNGEYAILGIIVALGEEEEGEGLEFTDCLEVFEDYKDEVIEKLVSMGMTAYKVSVFAFTHYS